MFIVGIAGMNSCTDTSASVTGLPLASLTATSKMLSPVFGGSGCVRKLMSSAGPPAAGAALARLSAPRSSAAPRAAGSRSPGRTWRPSPPARLPSRRRGSRRGRQDSLPDLHRPRREVAVTLRDEDDLVRAGIEQRVGRNRQTHGVPAAGSRRSRTCLASTGRVEFANWNRTLTVRVFSSTNG